MKFILPFGAESEDMVASTFWENFCMHHSKTAMLIISMIITISFAITETINRPSEKLETAFLVVIGFWAGRTILTKK